jgi:hypothetical protein
LYEGEKTWIRPLSWITFMVLTPYNSKFHLPSFVELRSSKENIWKNIDNNYQMVEELLTVVYSTLEPKDYYLKIDADTLVVPKHLQSFLRTHHGNIDYFGSDLISTKNVKILGKKINYAQGGIEGLSYRFIQTVVNDMCIQKIGNLACSKKYCLNKLEDVALGACAKFHNVSLFSYPCFFAWGPCNIYKPDTCKNKVCEETISIHKLKHVEWYRLWWNYLSTNRNL